MKRPRPRGPTGPARVAIIAAAAIAVASLYLASEKRIAGTWGYSLDDSWIHATMARNLATGHGFAFNADQPVAGATGPLYTFILAFLYLIFHSVIWPAKVLGILCQVGAGVAMESTVRALLPDRRGIALWAGVLTATAPSLVWGSLSGMEIPLYVLLVCVGLRYYVRREALIAIFVWSVGVWVRPDGVFLVALGLLGPPRELARRLLVAAPVLLAFFAFNHAVGGTWMPQTVGAKTYFGVDPVHRTWNLVREWGALWGIPYRATDDLEEPVLLLALLAVGSAVTLRKRPLLALYVIGLPIALSLFREQSSSHKRYILYVIPFGIALAAVGLDAIGRRWQGAAGRRVVAAIGAACLLWQLGYARAQAETHGWNVQNINQMHRTLGQFARDFTRPGERVATNDIGAIGYFSEREVVDLMGLITPMEPLPQMLSEYEPRLLVIFVDWFHSDAGWDPGSQGFVFYDADSSHKYMIVAGIELSRNTIASKDQMIAFARIPVDAPAPERLLMERY